LLSLLNNAFESNWLIIWDDLTPFVFVFYQPNVILNMKGDWQIIGFSILETVIDAGQYIFSYENPPSINLKPTVCSILCHYLITSTQLIFHWSQTLLVPYKRSSSCVQALFEISANWPVNSYVFTQRYDSSFLNG
jgi:hypothetical protein